MAIVKCTKRVSVGLFSVEEGTIWLIEGIKYNTDKAKSIVHIREKAEDSIKSEVWVEISQAILAECFELI